MYESRDNGYTPPMQMDSVSIKDEHQRRQMPSSHQNFSGVKSPILHSNQNSPTLKNPRFHHHAYHDGLLSDRLNPDNGDDMMGDDNQIL